MVVGEFDVYRLPAHGEYDECVTYIYRLNIPNRELFHIV